MNVVATAPYDLAPVASILALGALLALGPLLWVWQRSRAATPAARRSARLQALTLLTLCLTFDLVLFGAFTRLTDSGLGCPDWPGCYGSTSPLGAKVHIDAAQNALPEGPVTHGKAWIEMTHRYLATGVGALIVVLTALSWRVARQLRRVDRGGALPDGVLAGAETPSPWWASATLAWVCLQGLFGALTVTMKLHPLVVTAHLLGGMALLALLAVQLQLQRQKPGGGSHEAVRHEAAPHHESAAGTRLPSLSPSQIRSLPLPLPLPLSLPPTLYRAALGLALLSTLQMALGGWVSTHYAVLACSDFPRCQGSWWPAMDFQGGFTLLRDLNAAPDGNHLPFAALTAIHYAHRLTAYLVLAAMATFAWRLWRTNEPGPRRWAIGTVAIALWQLATGVSNVVLGWPLIAAVGHTAGAAAWVVLLASLLASLPTPAPARQAARIGKRLPSGTGSRLPGLRRPLPVAGTAIELAHEASEP